MSWCRVVDQPVCESVCFSVCLSVCVSWSRPWAVQNCWTDRDAVWDVDPCEPKHRVLDGHYLANMIEWSMCGGVASHRYNYCSNFLTFFVVLVWPVAPEANFLLSRVRVDRHRSWTPQPPRQPAKLKPSYIPNKHDRGQDGGCWLQQNDVQMASLYQRPACGHVRWGKIC